MEQTELQGMPPPTRPARSDCILTAANELAPEVQEWSSDNWSHEEVVNILIDHWDFDGYRFARKLEDIYWHPDAELVAILDEAEYLITRAHNKAVGEWIEKWDIKPKLEIGDKVKVNEKDGVIRDIYLYRGQYCVYIPSLGHLTDEQLEENRARTDTFHEGSLGRVLTYEEVEDV